MAAPFAPHLTCRVYDPAAEVRGTPLEHWPALYGQQDHRVWRDGDLFRILALHNYGGVYVDMDMVLLRSLGALLDQEFIYQWERFDDMYNGAIMHLRKGSAFARELIAGVMAIPPGEFNWGRENLRRAIERGRRHHGVPVAVLQHRVAGRSGLRAVPAGRPTAIVLRRRVRLALAQSLG